MKQGKVVLIGGTKRAGKTTLSILLHKNYGFNYLNFDHLEDAVDEGINKIDGYNNSEYFFGFLEFMINASLEDAKNYGVDTIIDTYMYSPQIVKKLKNLNEIDVYYLCDLDSNEEELRRNLKEYSKPYDWPSYTSPEQFEKNIQDILEHRKILNQECDKYGFSLINTSNGEKRDNILADLAVKIDNDRVIEKSI